MLDLHTRRVVGWAMSGRPDAELAVKALDMAYQQRGCPLHIPADHEHQFRFNVNTISGPM
ncbi:hypothetical protein [Aeromonas caviae]|uniref:hypothetical protein n=1 Tax=Aeromonas caviae TaxID=648 RepID=UPI0023509572|nr:hypothetical protein [Aeromonas caviae]